MAAMKHQSQVKVHQQPPPPQQQQQQQTEVTSQPVLFDTPQGQFNKYQQQQQHPSLISLQEQSAEFTMNDLIQQTSALTLTPTPAVVVGLGGVRGQIIHTASSNSAKYKTSLCRHYENGNCQLGSMCHFAHGDEDTRSASDPVPINIPSQPKVFCNNFKTVKCRYFERSFCKNNHACCFAHGDSDLASGLGSVYSSQGETSVIGNSSVSPVTVAVTAISAAAVKSPPHSSKNTDSILLISILKNLEHVFQEDPTILQNLKYAQQIAQQHDQKGAFNIISEIMKDPSRTEEEKAQYNTIYTNAQLFYAHSQLYSQNLLQAAYPQMPTQSNHNHLYYHQQQQQQQLQHQQPRQHQQPQHQQQHQYQNHQPQHQQQHQHQHFQPQPQQHQQPQHQQYQQQFHQQQHHQKHQHQSMSNFNSFNRPQQQQQLMHVQYKQTHGSGGSSGQKNNFHQQSQQPMQQHQLPSRAAAVAAFNSFQSQAD